MEKCNADVYDHGEVVSITSMGKDQAEAYCIEQSLRTGHKYDWHFAGGRAVIKA